MEDKLEFYFQHRKQISEWAAIEKRVDELMRDAFAQGSLETASRLIKGESGEPSVDFYMRNRAIIAEWAALQRPAGLALHQVLLATAEDRGFEAEEGKNGWTSVWIRRAELAELAPEKQLPRVEMSWTKPHLLTTGRGFPFPRVAVSIDPDGWTPDERASLIEATRPAAHSLGMNEYLTWWVHWRMLPEPSASEDLRTYADRSLDSLEQASNSLYPVIGDALAELTRGATGMDLG